MRNDDGYVGPGGARKPPRRAKPPTEKKANDRHAAKWFDEGLRAHPKAGSYAIDAGLDDGDLSKMRKGEVAVALRSLLPMQKHAPAALALVAAFLEDVELAEYPDEVLALVTPLLEEIGYVARPDGAPTFQQVATVAARLLADGGRPTRLLLEQECERQHGWSAVQVAIALRGQETDE